MKFLLRFFFICSILTNAQIALAKQGERLAFVVGNANYDSIGKLNNPLNDAEDVGDKLQRLGFTVTEVNDADRRQFLIKLNQFANKITRNTEVVLFFYSGHGLQYSKESYLVPVDAEIQTDADINIATIPAKHILNKLQDKNPLLTVMVLDACRNYPFSELYPNYWTGV